MFQLSENDYLKIVYESYFDIYFLTKTVYCSESTPLQ
jgi:hypothetical protein